MIAVLMPTPKRLAACRRDKPSRSTDRTTRSRRSTEYGYPSGEGRLYAEDVIVNIEGAAGTMIVSV